MYPFNIPNAGREAKKKNGVGPSNGRISKRV